MAENGAAAGGGGGTPGGTPRSPAPAGGNSGAPGGAAAGKAGSRARVVVVDGMGGGNSGAAGGGAAAGGAAAGKAGSRARVVVVDGMGGGIGEELVRRLALAPLPPDVEILALATNAVATERMVRAGAHRGAAGENAITQSVKLGDIILGPIGIIIANSMLGEITSAMAGAILAAPGKRILIPLQNDHIALAGIEELPLSKMIEKSIEMVKKTLKTLKIE